MDTHLTQETYRLRCGVAVYAEQHKAFEQLLTEALTQIPANFVFLADVAGQVILAKGEHKAVNLVMLGSLVAGDLAASQEIARLTGQFQDYQIVLREGANVNTFITEAGQYLVLLVQVDHDVPLGWARMIVKQAGQRLGQVMEGTTTAVGEQPPFTLGDSNSNLSELFDEALDDLWGET